VNRKDVIIYAMNTEIKTITSWLGAGSLDIFGCPFSGKDTQGKILAELFGGKLIGGGEILRSHKDPQKINRILASGGIIPSDFYLDLMVPYLSRSNLRDMPLILSAVGRSHGEEPIIMKAAADSGHPIKAVIFLNLSEAEVWARFQDAKIINDRGERADDSSEALKTRLIKFRDKTIPVIEFYRDKGLLLEVNGKLSVQEVTDGILQGLLKRSVE
jgi:adenylate kinase